MLTADGRESRRLSAISHLHREAGTGLLDEESHLLTICFEQVAAAAGRRLSAESWTGLFGVDSTSLIPFGQSELDCLRRGPYQHIRTHLR